MAKKGGKFVFVKVKGKTIKLHPTEKYIRERVREPKEFQPETFRTIESGRHKLIIGRPKRKKTTALQAILHPESLKEVKKEIKMRRQLGDIDLVEFEKERREHPWATQEQIAKIIKDHERARLKIDVSELSYPELERLIKSKEAEKYVEGFHIEPGKSILILKPTTQLTSAHKEIKKLKKEKKALEQEAKKLTEGELLVLAKRKNIEPIEQEVYLKELESRGLPARQLTTRRKLYVCIICGKKISEPAYSKNKKIYKLAHLQEYHPKHYKNPDSMYFFKEIS